MLSMNKRIIRIGRQKSESIDEKVERDKVAQIMSI